MGVKQNSATAKSPKTPFCARFWLFLIATGLFGSAIPVWAAPPPAFSSQRAVIALDPGHGGNDRGAKAAHGTVEKQLCLTFALQLSQLLEPAYQVVLTRGDDYALDLRERTAVGNHNKADILISLHAAAAFVHSTSGINIYYYKPKKQVQRGSSSGAPAWEEAQLPYVGASLTLANFLRQSLAAIPETPPVQVFQAPLVVLQGAAMPAVVIELGYLTNSSDEEALASAERRSRYARSIAKAIGDYLVNSGK